MARVDAQLSEKFEDAQRRLVTQASDFSLESVAQMVDTAAIDPSPEYQRRQRWNVVRQSSLIESFLLNVPVPPVYLAEERFGVYSVIDGKQRITAIHDFMRGRFYLRALQALPELNGAFIHDLPEVMANALRVRPYIRAVTLLKQSDPELKFEVFLRLNRGGESLTSQEVRHVAFRGPLNDLLIRLGEEPFLRSQFNVTDTSERYRQMQDVEYVLRFLTLRHVYPAFSGDLSATMDSFMLENADPGGSRLELLEESFRRSLAACEAIWGEYSFRRAEPQSDSGAWRGRALLGMYDAQMLAVASASPSALQAAADARTEVIAETAALFAEPEFVAAVTVGTNTSARLRTRVSRVSGVLAKRA